MSDSTLNAGLPSIPEDENALPSYFEDDRTPDQILQITFAQNEDDASLTDVFFAGDNLDAEDEAEIFAALLSALKVIEPSNDMILQALQLIDENNS